MGWAYWNARPNFIAITVDWNLVGVELDYYLENDWGHSGDLASCQCGVVVGGNGGAHGGVSAYLLFNGMTKVLSIYKEMDEYGYMSLYEVKYDGNLLYELRDFTPDPSNNNPPEPDIIFIIVIVILIGAVVCIGVAVTIKIRD